MSENNLILEHVISMKEAIATQTALLTEVKSDLVQHAKQHAKLDIRVMALEVWPTTVKIFIKVIVGGLAFFGSAFGVVKALQPAHQSLHQTSQQVGRASPSP